MGLSGFSDLELECAASKGSTGSAQRHPSGEASDAVDVEVIVKDDLRRKPTLEIDPHGQGWLCDARTDTICRLLSVATLRPRPTRQVFSRMHICELKWHTTMVSRWKKPTESIRPKP